MGQPLGPNLHGTEDQLELYALSRLPESELPILEEHLLACTACQEKLNEIEHFAVGMREALGKNSRSRTIAAPRAGALKRLLRKPAFSMTLGFVVLIALLGVFSNGRTRVAPTASLQLIATRGEMPSTVPAREFDLTLSGAPGEGGPFRVDVVNAMGGSMWSTLAESNPSGMRVKVTQRLNAGDYFVRLYDPSGRLLREYGFRIRP